MSYSSYSDFGQFGITKPFTISMVTREEQRLDIVLKTKMKPTREFKVHVFLLLLHLRRFECSAHFKTNISIVNFSPNKPLISENSSEQSTLTVLVKNNAPFALFDPGENTFKGLEISLIETIAKRLNLTPLFIEDDARIIDKFRKER